MNNIINEKVDRIVDLLGTKIELVDSDEADEFHFAIMNLIMALESDIMYWVREYVKQSLC